MIINGSGFPSRFSLYDPRESLLQTKENCHVMFLLKIITALLQLSPSPQEKSLVVQGNPYHLTRQKNTLE